MSRSISDNASSTATAKDIKTTTAGPVATTNIGWNKRLLDTNKPEVDKKGNVENADTETEVASLRAMIQQIKNDMQEKLSQLKLDIEKEKEARKVLEKEVQTLRNKN